MLQNYTPYTYLLTTPEKCLKCDRYRQYYGVRYAKNCHPTDFWQKYFTSSNEIKQLIKQYGKDSFTFEIRKTFSSEVQARIWESTVLKRLDVIHKNHWINRHDTEAFAPECSAHTNRTSASKRMSKLNKTRQYITYSCEKCNKIGKGTWFKNHHKINNVDLCVIKPANILIGCVKCKTNLLSENWEKHLNKCQCNQIKERPQRMIKGSLDYRKAISDSLKEYYKKNPHSEELKLQKSKKLKGRIFSAEHRNNIKKSLKEKNTCLFGQ